MEVPRAGEVVASAQLGKLSSRDTISSNAPCLQGKNGSRPADCVLVMRVMGLGANLANCAGFAAGVHAPPSRRRHRAHSSLSPHVSAYVHIAYPGGDVPADTGVCTDEVIRSYRAVGVDLQKEVHEDMVKDFAAYPNKRRWLLAHADANIDHRRVPNLMVFFQRKGESLPITARAEDYAPGDLVTWDLGGNVPHIGIVVDQKARTGRYMIVHNIGEGPKMEDVLFNWKITGHYRYFGP
jgi:uncharacterized protein